jgi:hypothetical protein
MVTIKIEFEYEGKRHNLKAMLNNDLSKLSKSKNNNATEIVDDFGDDGRWSLYFADFDDGHDVEVMMYRDADGDKQLEADYAIIWNKGNNGVIEDEIDVKSSVKHT